MKNLKLLFVVLATVLFAVSCNWQDEEYFDSPDNTLLKSAVSFETTDWPQTYCGTVQYHDLIGGQTINMGSVAVVNDGEFLYVKYSADPGYLLIETHLYIGEDLPVNKAGNPVIGQFPFATENYDGSGVVIHKISLEGLDDCFDVYAHAVVVCADEEGNVALDELGNYICEETAWGAGGGEDLVFAIKAWFGDDWRYAMTTGTLINQECDSWGKDFGYINLDLKNLPIIEQLVPGQTSGEVKIEMDELNNQLIFTMTSDIGPTKAISLFVGTVNELLNLLQTDGCVNYYAFPFIKYFTEIIEVPISDLPLSSGEYNYFESTRWGFYFNYCVQECD